MPIASAGGGGKPKQPRINMSMNVTESHGDFQPITNRDGQITEFVISLTGQGLSWLLPEVSMI